MSEVRIAAEPRTEFGKGGARRTRRAGKVPAVLYGHGGDPVHLSLPAREVSRAFRLEGANVLLNIEVEGTNQLALAKSIQRHAVRGDLEHIDLVRVEKGEKVNVDVPVHLVGEAATDTIVMHESTTITIEAEATHLPEALEVDITGLEAGNQITASDVKLPAGSTLAGNPDTVVVAVTAAPTAEQVEAELAAAEEDLGAGAAGAAAKAEEEAAEAPAEAAAEGASGEGDTVEETAGEGAAGGDS